MEINDSVKPQFKIKVDEIKKGENIKYLGVQVDQQLKLSSQLTLTISKISKGIGILRYSKRFVPASTVKLMYCSALPDSLVVPYLAALFGGNVGETSLDKLQKLQNRAARTVTGCQHDQSALPIIRTL